MSAHDIAAAETAAMSKARGYRHKRLTFVTAAEDDGAITECTPKSQGKDISSFYSELVGLRSSSRADEQDSLQKQHSTTIPEQLALPHLDPPVTRLPVDEHSAGHRYLVRYGWHPLQREGLGPVGREGRRVPLKVEKRPQKLGVGAKVSKDRAELRDKDKDVATKLTKGKRKKQEREARLQEQTKSRRMYDEIFRR